MMGPEIMQWAVWLLLGTLTLYAACLLVLALIQRRMMYFPGGVQGTAVEEGLKQAETFWLATSDSERLVAWYQAAAAGMPLFLYFHGNGGNLANRVPLLARLSEDGSGFLAIDYRGYGGSTGSPTERGLLRDGDAAYVKIRDLGYPPDRIVIVGESLGTGVAVAIAATRPAKAVVLDSAFSAAVDVGAARFWMFPLRLLMRDTFEAREHIARVAAPKLFLHGTADPVVPIAFGQALFDRAASPKTFVALPGRGHIVLWAPDVLADVKAWLAALS